MNRWTIAIILMLALHRLIFIGYSFEKAQVVGIVGIVGMFGMVWIVGINK